MCRVEKGTSMVPVNAIGKVRFSSARGQRVHLIEADDVAADLLCLEKGQELSPGKAPAVLYVIAGTAAISQGGQQTRLPMGQVVRTDGACTLVNIGEQRVICLAMKALR